MSGDWTCAHCGVTIGVYEPLVICDGAGGRVSSRVNERSLAPGARGYHRHCWQEQAPAGEPAERAG